MGCSPQPFGQHERRRRARDRNRNRDRNRDRNADLDPELASDGSPELSTRFTRRGGKYRLPEVPTAHGFDL